MELQRPRTFMSTTTQALSLFGQLIGLKAPTHTPIAACEDGEAEQASDLQDLVSTVTSSTTTPSRSTSRTATSQTSPTSLSPGLTSRCSLTVDVAGDTVLVLTKGVYDGRLVSVKTQKCIAEHDYHFLVVVDPLRELSGGDGTPAVGAVVEAWNVTEESSPSGAVARAGTPEGKTVAFTIGGVIAIDRCVYALTAGRVFREDVVGLGTESERSGSEDEDDDWGSEDDSPFVSFDRNHIEKQTTSSFSVPRTSMEGLGGWSIGSEHLPVHADDTTARSDQVVIGSLCVPIAPSRQLDWALIKLNSCHPTAWGQNEFPVPGIPGSLRNEILIVDSANDTDLQNPDKGCDVWVYCGVSGPKKVPGGSGAWVIRDGKVSGHIVVGRKVSPLAYMILMDAILDDIKTKLGANEVAVSALSKPPGQKGNNVDDFGALDQHPPTSIQRWTSRLPSVGEGKPSDGSDTDTLVIRLWNYSV
ncbi:hypothetical protein OQA88_8739 [Cercophora sp. LCS_1]